MGAVELCDINQRGRPAVTQRGWNKLEVSGETLLLVMKQRVVPDSFCLTGPSRLIRVYSTEQQRLVCSEATVGVPG